MEVGKYDSLNFWQKAAVHHAHPASFTLNVLGVLWGSFFLWTHHWFWAAVCFAFMVIGGIVWGALDRSYLLEARSQLNTFQKLLVYHTNPVNLILHLIALVLYVSGIWAHSTLLILLGISFVCLGHIFPWLYHRKQERLFTLMMDEDVSDKR